MTDKPTYDELEKRVSELERAQSAYKKAEEKLRQSEKRFSIIFHTNPAAIALTKLDNNRLVDVNEAWQALTGYTHDEAVGHTALELDLLVLPPQREEIVNMVRHGGMARDEVRIRRKAGEIIDVLLSAEIVELSGERFLLTMGQDISDRKKAEEALKESEAKFRNFAENSLVGIFIAENDRFIYVNPKFAEIFGYSTEECLNNMHFQQVIHPDDFDTVQERVHNLLLGKFETANCSFSGVRKCGSAIDVEIFGSKILLQGRLVATGILLDITKRKKMEAELILREREYRTLLESIPDFVVRYDPDLRRIYVNPAWEKASGLSAGEVVNVPITDTPRVPVPAPDEYVQKLRQVLKTGAAQTIEFSWINANGVKLFVDYIIVPEYDRYGKIAGLLTAGRDITDRKQAEEALRESEEKYRTMMEAFTDPLYICSPNFTVEYMNPAMIRRVGRDATGERCYRAINGLDAKCDWCVFDKVLQGENVETTIKSPLDERDYRITHMPIQNQDGTMSKMTIFRDITDYLQAVSEREAVHAQLIKAQKMESIGNLAGGIAHDFNNVLSSIIGFTELALDEVQIGTSLKDYLNEVHSAGKRAKKLVKQILAFARQSDEKRSPIQPGTIVKEVLMFIRSTIPTTIDIRQEIKSDALIMGNTTHVHQVLMNLCTNAAHAMEDAGGILRVKVKDVVIGKAESPIGLRQGDYVEITVSDTGAGIAPDIIDSVFDPYFTTKGPGEGTGMGLAVAQGVIESYGGVITVDSRLGKGTTFTIYLPVTQKQADRRENAGRQLPSGTEHILFVDDESAIVNMGGQILKRLGYSVTTSTSSLDALALFRAKPDAFDLVITDMTMPNLTGDKLATELIKIRPDIPVILCTGYSKKITVETAFKIGIKALAYKPMVRADLAKTIRNVLDDDTKPES